MNAAAAAYSEWSAGGRGRPLALTVILIRSDPPCRPQPQIWSKTRVRGRHWVTAGMWFKGHCRRRKWFGGGGSTYTTIPGLTLTAVPVTLSFTGRDVTVSASLHLIGLIL